MTKSRYSVLRQRSRERGQVLILAVLAMVILTTAVLVLFDVQRIMRGKIKVMSGIDAAALTGAAWQKNSLNLIGELNLVKACDVLISDALYGIGGNPDDYMKLQLPQNPTPAEIEAAVEKARQELAQLKNSADMLTEMQVCRPITTATRIWLICTGKSTPRKPTAIPPSHRRFITAIHGVCLMRQ